MYCFDYPSILSHLNFVACLSGLDSCAWPYCFIILCRSIYSSTSDVYRLAAPWMFVFSLLAPTREIYVGQLPNNDEVRTSTVNTWRSLPPYHADTTHAPVTITLGVVQIPYIGFVPRNNGAQIFSPVEAPTISCTPEPSTSVRDFPILFL